MEKKNGIFHLMHKNTLICDLMFANNNIIDIPVIYHEKILPYLLRDKYKNKVVAINEWIKGRGIPSKRIGVNDNLMKSGVSTVEELVVFGFANSLTDYYWICKYNQSIKYNEIDYRNLKGSELVTLRIVKDSGESPDNTSDGYLNKQWQLDNGEIKLVKFSEFEGSRESINEVFVSEYCNCLGLAAGDYVIYNHPSKPVEGRDISEICVCNTFLKEDEEYINAWNIKKGFNIQSTSEYEGFISMCEKIGFTGGYGVEQLKLDLSKIILVDFIIGNEDRHWGNFGIIRDVITLKIKRISPIFDNGNSMFFGRFKVEATHENIKNIKGKMFTSNNYKQLKYVDVRILKSLNLNNIDELIGKYYSEFGEAFVNSVTRIINARIEIVKGL